MLYNKYLSGVAPGLPRMGKSWLAVTALVLLAGACSDEVQTPVASPPLLETGADMVIQGLRHIITLNGVKEGELYADSAFFYRDSSIYHLRTPELILFTEGSGVQRARVTAERGRFNPNTREMLAQGGVILVITEGNKRVESEELHYDPNGDRIWSDSMTAMVEPGRVTEGMGFDSDLNFRRTVVGPGSIRNTGGNSSGEGSPAERNPSSRRTPPVRNPGGGGGSTK